MSNGMTEANEFGIHPSWEPKLYQLYSNDKPKVQITATAWQSDLFERRFAKKVHDLNLDIRVIEVWPEPDADMSDYHDLADRQVVIRIIGTNENVKSIIRWIRTCTTWS